MVRVRVASLEGEEFFFYKQKEKKDDGAEGGIGGRKTKG